ncbi:MAG: hypothetical protein H7836_17280, partial [Magnetococcus sp. YQC-3]
MKKKTSRPRRKIGVTRVAMRGIPDKMLVKLPYTDLQGVTAFGAPNWRAQKSYNVNGLYDPETLAINQQPLYFNEYAGLYSRYRVYKIDYDVTMINTTNSATAGSLTFAAGNDAPNLLDNQQLEQPYSRRFTLGLGSASTSAQSQKRVKGSIFLPRVAGLTSE